MVKCWRENSEERPAFRELLAELEVLAGKKF